MPVQQDVGFALIAAPFRGDRLDHEVLLASRAELDALEVSA